MLFYGVVCDPLDEAIELCADRRAAELVVRNWNRDEPERAGELGVEPIEIETALHLRFGDEGVERAPQRRSLALPHL
jgi:hypothetical protein